MRAALRLGMGALVLQARVALGAEPAKPTEAAEPVEKDAGQLSHDAQNPIANLISIPIQLNFNGGIGPFERTQMVLNIQPVIPIPLVERLTLVTRWILPIIGQAGGGRAGGDDLGAR